MGEDATANPSTLRQMRNGSMEIQHAFFTQEKENEEMLGILMRSKKGSKQKKKKPYDTHLHITLKLAYHRMFWLVSGKGRRRPFCPDDEWAGLTGHFSLPLSLFHSLSLAPSVLSSSSCLSTTPSDSKPQFVPSDWGPGDGFHQVTDLLASARGKTPQTLSNARRTTAGETRLKRHLYLLGSQ